MQDILKNRTTKIQNKLKEQEIESLLVSDSAHITYLTGVYPISRYEREGYILLTQSEAVILSSGFSFEKFKEVEGLKVLKLDQNHRLSSYLNRMTQADEVYIEAHDLKVEEMIKLEKASGKTLKPCDKNIFLDARIIKDESEIALIQKACQITQETFSEIQALLKTNKKITEILLAHEIIRLQNSKGSQGIPFGFDPIVAFGPHSARPHHNPGQTGLKKNTPILFDFGACVGGYASDYTRTIWYGDTPSTKFLEIEKHVLEAYKKSLQVCKPGHRASQLDKVVFKYFKKHSLEDLFIHTTGHGLGLDVHEKPSLYRNLTEDVVLEPGMVITIEPGLYFSGSFGYRYENTVLVTDRGFEELT